MGYILWTISYTEASTFVKQINDQHPLILLYLFQLSPYAKQHNKFVQHDDKQEEL